jgi:hypothetical protein
MGVCVGHRSRSVPLEEDRNLLSLPGIEPRLLWYPVRILLTVPTVLAPFKGFFFFLVVVVVVLFYLLRISRFSVEVVSSFDHTDRHTTVGRTPLDEGSARRRGLYLTTHNTHNRQTSMP